MNTFALILRLPIAYRCSFQPILISLTKGLRSEKMQRSEGVKLAEARKIKVISRIDPSRQSFAKLSRASRPLWNML